VSSYRMPRRAIVGTVLATSLIGGGLAVAFADGAPVADGCPATYTDPAGDSGLLDPATNPVVGDDDLDLVAVTHSVTDGIFTTAFKVVKLNPAGPAFAAGDRFVATFTVAKKTVTVDAERDFSGVGDTHGSVTVGGTAVTMPVKIVEDDKASTLSAQLATADLEKAVGAPLAGEAFSAMSAVARGFLPSNATPSEGILWDAATAPATASYAFGSGCGATAGAPAAAPAPSPSPSTPSAAPAPGGPAAPGLPTAGCNTFADPKGDANFDVVNGQGEPNDPDLDLTGLVLQSTPDSFKAYLRVDKLATRPADWPGHAFYANFTANKKAVALQATAYDPAQLSQLDDGAATATGVTPFGSTPAIGMTVDGPYVPSKLSATFDTKTSMVTLTIPRGDLDKAVGGLADGSVLTKVYARDAGTAPVAGGFYIDSTAKDNASGVTDKDAWTVGDNACFGPAAPAPSPLTNVGAVKAQYGDTAAVAAKLVDASGAPVAGKTVTFTLGSSKAAGTTGTDGVAKASLVVNEKAGKKTLVLTSDAVTASVPFTVLIEKTVLKATGSKGAVTAILSDDDRTPVAGQVITFTLGSKKATARTDAKGVAKVTGFPPGNVKVAYAGASGMYAAASTSTKA
jgi:hypothetical protein